MSTDPTRTALGTWSGGVFMHFGEAIDAARYQALITPDERIPTVISADVYGTGEADAALGHALRDAFADGRLTRDRICVAGVVGHDFYTGKRDGAKGYPRFTDPRLRGPEQYADYLKMATEKSLERCGVDRFDLLMLHNPDRTGYTSETVWNAMESLRSAGYTRLLGVAPGPANGFTLDLIDCFERFGDRIDWAMLILNPLEPWPGQLCLEAASTHDVKVIARVVDYGGIFHDDLLSAEQLGPSDHRAFRPAGWVDAARAKLERMRPFAQRHELTLLQLACEWTLAHPAVRTVVPTLVQEVGPAARPVEDKRAELASLPAQQRLSTEEVEQIRAIGDNRGSMALKGANPDFTDAERADNWALYERLQDVARRWSIDPARDLVMKA